jgi:hypothetical protein
MILKKSNNLKLKSFKLRILDIVKMIMKNYSIFQCIQHKKIIQLLIKKLIL